MTHEADVNMFFNNLRLYRWNPVFQDDVNPRQVCVIATSVVEARAILQNEHNTILNRRNTIHEDDLPPLEEWEQDVPHEERVRRHVEDEFDENLEANHLRICFPFSSIELDEQVLEFVLNNEPFETRAVPRVWLLSAIDG
jgi:hypothetical protein